jgi:hypothetical protein
MKNKVYILQWQSSRDSQWHIEGVFKEEFHALAGAGAGREYTDPPIFWNDPKIVAGEKVWIAYLETGESFKVREMELE